MHRKARGGGREEESRRRAVSMIWRLVRVGRRICFWTREYARTLAAWRRRVQYESILERVLGRYTLRFLRLVHFFPLISKYWGGMLRSSKVFEICVRGGSWGGWEVEWGGRGEVILAWAMMLRVGGGEGRLTRVGRGAAAMGGGWGDCGGVLLGGGGVCGGDGGVAGEVEFPWERAAWGEKQLQGVNQSNFPGH